MTDLVKGYSIVEWVDKIAEEIGEAVWVKIVVPILKDNLVENVGIHLAGVEHPQHLCKRLEGR